MKRTSLLFLLLMLGACEPSGGNHTNNDAGIPDALVDTDTLDTGPDAAPDTGPDATQDTGPDAQDAEPDAQDSGPDADAGQTTDPTPLRDDAAGDVNPYEWGNAVADRTALGSAFTAAGYAPPTGAFLLIGRVLAGVDSPAVRWYSYGDTAFTYSPGNYWPASTVKLTASVGALRTLGTYGLTSQAQVSFTDDDGAYSGSVEALIGDAIRISSNVAYNRLMEIAGFEEMNQDYLTDADGYPNMVLQRRYTHPLPSSNLRVSPEVTYSEGSLSGTIPERTGTSTYPACTGEANCITLFELLDVMRRVTLRVELPATERFDVTATDGQMLLGALNDAPSTMESGAQAALGSNITVYNKTGLVPGDDRLDHGLIVDNATGERFLVAVSLPYDTTTEAELAELVREALIALPSASIAHPPLQTTAGVPITVQMDDLGWESGTGYRLVDLTFEAPGADALTLWIDRWSMPSPTPAGITDRFTLTHAFSQQGLRHVVILALAGGTPVGYRRLTLDIPDTP